MLCGAISKGDRTHTGIECGATVKSSVATTRLFIAVSTVLTLSSVKVLSTYISTSKMHCTAENACWQGKWQPAIDTNATFNNNCHF